MAQHSTGNTTGGAPSGTTASAEGTEAAHAGIVARYIQSLKARKPLPIVVTVIAAIVVVALVVWGVLAAMTHVEDNRGVEEIRRIAAPSVKAGEKTNIDWGKYRGRNSEIYAWLYVPGTDVNMPVVQHYGDDEYYLNHNFWGESSELGAAYTEMQNSQDFSDPVTVMYGHDVASVFKSLHNFEDESFFEKHDKMYVYTPNNKMYTYKIVSAYRGDDSHILNTNNLKSASGRSAYFNKVLHPSDSIQHVRAGASLKADDKVLQLSTCMLNEWHGAHRYIITGVLEGVEDVNTK